MTVRRIATLAAAGLLAASALTACRAESGVALYVGDEQFGEERVEAIVDDAPDGLALNGQPIDRGGLRQITVKYLALTELAEQVSTETGRPLPGPDYAGSAGSLGDNDFARMVAEYEAWKPYLLATADPASAEEIDVDAITAYVNEQIGEEVPGLADAITASAADPANEKVFAERRELLDLFEEYDLVINPRYGDIAVNVGEVALTWNGQTRPFTITAPIPTD